MKNDDSLTSKSNDTMHSVDTGGVVADLSGHFTSTSLHRQESRSGSGGHQDWQGPHTVVVPRLETGLGFTLRHFVVYPPPSVLDDSRSEQDYSISGDQPSLQREVSLEPQDTIFVKSVKTGSAAHLAGLCTGDRIVAVNGDSINGKSYGEVIALIQNSPKNLKLLVVPKDDDILQMAYQSAGDPMYSSSASLSDTSGHPLSIHQPPTDEQWNDRVTNSLSDLSNSNRLRSQSTGSTDLDSNPVQELPSLLDTSSNISPPQMSQDVGSKMTSPSIACNIPSKTKYSFGLYFPPRSKASQPVSSNVGINRVAGTNASQGSLNVVDSGSKGDKSQSEMPNRRTDTTKVRKASLDESSTSLSTARAKEYFIRYSANKSASDARQRYASRHSAYERTSVEKPNYVISRSQTVSTISPAHTQRSSLSGSVVRHSMEIPTRRGSEDSLDTKVDPVGFYSQSSGVSKQTDNRIITTVEGSPLRGGKTTKSQGDLSANSNGGRRTFVVRIPYEQQQRPQPPQGNEVSTDSKQMYGTTFAVTRSPAITRVEIQKTVGMPIVSHRKHLFESGQNENNPPTFHIGPQNRYKSEIERIRTQPKFSSVATRMASFEQSPDRDPSGSENEEKTPSSAEVVSASIDTAQPTIKVRKISSERHPQAVQLQTSGNTESSTTIIRGGFSEPTPIHIYVSSSGSSAQSTPIVEIVSRQIPPDNAKQSVVRNDNKVSQNNSQDDHRASPSLSSTNSGVTMESGMWSKSYHGSSDMIDGTSSVADSNVFASDVDQDVMTPSSRQAPKPARKTSYLTAVNAPRSIQDGRGVYTQPPQPMFAQSQMVPHKASISPSPSSSSLLTGPVATYDGPLPSSHPQARPYSAPQSKVIVTPHPSANEIKGHPAFPSSVSANSLNSVISEMSTTSLTPAVMSASDSAIIPMDRDAHLVDTAAFGSNNCPVQLRRKPIDSYEDQANKLHRRTSYLMATARDRTNTVPIEKAFCPHPIIEQLQSVQPAVSQSSSAKLNKFFGEKIPSIAEGMESRVEEEEPPEIIRKGPLFCKISVWESKKCSDRSWKQVYAILKPTELFLTRDKESSTSSNFEDHHVPLQSYMVEFARDYAKKKKNVFRLTTHDECVYLFHAEDRGTTLCWFQAIKSINEPDKNENTGTPEQVKHMPVEINIIPANKASPPMGHKSKKLSALSLKAKLSSSPSMRRKKSNASEKDKEEVVVKKSWKGRIPMMKSLRKHSEDVILPVHLEPDDGDSIRQFGVPLEDCFPSPHNEFVPLIVELCTRIVEARGLEVIGVYRVPGNSAAINALTEEFNNGIDNVNIDNEKLLDINVISSLLKSFFRKLPEPLVNSENYDAFIEANRNPDPDKRMLKLKRLLHLLPPHHNETFKHMAEHLYKVASYGNINKMDAKNLALMFGPTLIRKTEDDTVSLVTDMSDQCRIIESIILHHEWFFSPWDQDNHIPMETTVETVLPDEGHGFKDDDEEADSAISTKEIISSIVGAASRKLRNQQQKSQESLLDGNMDSLDASSLDKRGLDTSSHLSALSKSETSLTSAHSADDGLSQSTFSSIQKLSTAPIAHSEPDSLDLEFADATSPSVSSLSHHFSSESLLDKNDELEISHGHATSMSRDAIHNTLKRIGNDVYTLLQTFEQKQLKERERWRREQEQIEREHQRTQLELEEDEIHSIDDWLAVKTVPSRMPDVVSSSYIGETYPYGGYSSPTLSDSDRKERAEKDRRVVKSNQGNLQSSSKSYHSRHGSFDSVPSRSPYGSSFDEFVTDNNQRAMMSKSATQSKPPDMRQKNIHLAVDKQHLRPSSIRNSMGHRHGSLDSLIDLIDKRSSWASSDSEDGADLLTSLTTTFDQKLKILVNPKYKLTGMSGRKHFRNDSGIPATLVSEAKDLKDSSAPLRPVEGNKHLPLPAAFVESDRPFRDPSLHRSSKPEAKVGIASRFERNDNRALSSSPVMNVQEHSPVGRNSKKSQAPDFRSFLGRSSVHSPRESGPVVLTQPRKLDDSGIIVLRSINKSRKGDSQRSYSKSEKTEMNLARLSKEGKGLIEDEEERKQDNKENEGKRRSDKRQGVRRHTVGGTEDFEHIDALVQVCSNEVPASAATGEPRPSAWDQLQPVVKDSAVPGDRSLQAWLHRERMRGSTPDLSAD